MSVLKVLICEFNHFHAEVLPIYSPLLPSFLGQPPEKIQIDYLLSPSIYKQATWIAKNRRHLLESIWMRYWVSKTGLRQYYYTYLLNRFIKIYNPQLLIFNTIESKRFLTVFNRAKATRKIAMIHNPADPVYQSFKKQNNMQLFCLNKYNYLYWENKQNKSNKNILSGYWTTAFPAFIFNDYAAKDYIEIVIPGRIDFAKRDYSALLTLAKALKNKNTFRIKFNLLADIQDKHGPLLKKDIFSQSLQDYFIFHAHRPDDQAFARNIFHADYILPLLRENSIYMQGVASASLVHSLAYRKPLILLPALAQHMQIPEDYCLTYQDVTDCLAMLTDTEKTDTLQKKYQSYVDYLIRDNKIFFATAEFDNAME